MAIMLAGSRTSFSFEHPEKVRLLRMTTLSGSVMRSSFVQFWKLLASKTEMPVKCCKSSSVTKAPAIISPRLLTFTASE